MRPPRGHGDADGHTGLEPAGRGLLRHRAQLHSLRPAMTLKFPHVLALALLALAQLAPGLALLLLEAALAFYLLLAAVAVALTEYHKWRFRAVQPAAGRFALVTGASSGLGKEMALQLAAKKFPVVLASRTESALARLAKEISEAHGVDALYCACDLSTQQGVEKLEKFVRDRDLVVDILVNNAGTSVNGDFTDLSTDEVEHLLALDMAAMVRLTHAILPQMVQRGIGHVMNVSSLAGFCVIPCAALYSSSKAFVRHFSQAIDYELRSTGVSVTCACPGPIMSNFGKAANCEEALYFKSPGAVWEAKDAAAAALRAMFAGETIAHDSWYSYVNAFLLGYFAPGRTSAAICAIHQYPLSETLKLLKR